MLNKLNIINKVDMMDQSDWLSRSAQIGIKLE